MWLWLDDERKAPSGWVVLRTAESAIKVLNAGLVSRVSLDHDLGGRLTGYDVACCIEQLAFDGRISRIQWEIHSANPVGRARMTQALLAADRAWTRREFGGSTS